MNYGKLWMSLISGNVKKIKKYGERLGAGELFPLFACMVTARSWDSVSKGIDKKAISKEEVCIQNLHYFFSLCSDKFFLIAS